MGALGFEPRSAGLFYGHRVESSLQLFVNWIGRPSSNHPRLRWRRVTGAHNDSLVTLCPRLGKGTGGCLRKAGLLALLLLALAAAHLLLAPLPALVTALLPDSRAPLHVLTSGAPSTGARAPIRPPLYNLTDGRREGGCGAWQRSDRADRPPAMNDPPAGAAEIATRPRHRDAMRPIPAVHLRLFYTSWTSAAVARTGTMQMGW